MLTSRAADFCSVYNPPRVYIDIKNKTENEIQKFANLKTIAKQADQVLSKLLTAKSPVIAAWISKNDLASKTDEEVVKGWRLYYAKNFILSKYPYNDKDIDLQIEKLLNKINGLFSSKTYQNKMQQLFEQSRKNAITTINLFSIEDSMKKKIINRIEDIRLYWMIDFKDSKFKKFPLDFLDWGIAYDPIPNEINMGVNSLNYPNDETYIAVFSHEIAHSFDSCRWGAYFEGAWPFTQIAECLRSDESAGAKKRDDSKMEEMIKSGNLPKDLAEALKINNTCNKSFYPAAGIQADQLPETFSDWFATEVLLNMNNINNANIRTDLCEIKNLQPGSSYTSNETRLNKIYFAPAKFRSSRGDLKMIAVKYCSFSPAATSSN